MSTYHAVILSAPLAGGFSTRATIRRMRDYEVMGGIRWAVAAAFDEQWQASLWRRIWWRCTPEARYLLEQVAP